jgi:hypothetical protein
MATIAVVGSKLAGQGNVVKRQKAPDLEISGVARGDSYFGCPPGFRARYPKRRLPGSHALVNRTS